MQRFSAGSGGSPIWFEHYDADLHTDRVPISEIPSEQEDLGFNKANVIRMNLNNRELQSKAAEFAEALKRLPSVVSIWNATSAPGDNIGKGLFKVEDAEGRWSTAAWIFLQQTTTSSMRWE